MSKSTTEATEVGSSAEWLARAIVYSEVMEGDDQQYWTGFADALQMLHDGVIIHE